MTLWIFWWLISQALFWSVNIYWLVNIFLLAAIDFFTEWRIESTTDFPSWLIKFDVSSSTRLILSNDFHDLRLFLNLNIYTFLCCSFFCGFPPSLARKLKNNRVWEPSAKACSSSIDQLAFRLSLAVVSMTGYCCPFVMITSRQFCQENSCKSLTFEIENTQVFPKDSHVQQIYYLHKLFLKSSWADDFQCSY